ncbi:uncharacterized protein LOC129959239 [Argiope bruennichi]|uniref:uncharacterized protein LOC129959239 n=1 Tax=Argiope bruennichi TaxID=94029 RepID=UPI0024944CF1|nr:uncharacterized protein LOC129959239 [Argiope bruennichi]
MDQVLYFSQKIRDAHNLKLTNHTVAAFLDLSKAFDRVWKYKLVCKLYRTFKLRGRILPWFAEFLKARYIRVKFRDTMSGKFRLSQGIPQGSVLSPTLFSFFLAGIEAEANSDHYQDESQVYQVASSGNLNKLERVQLSAARVITGLCNSCPRDVVLYEADLQPLRLHSKYLLAKCFAKLITYGDQHRTSSYVHSWSNNRRFKRESLLSHAESEKLPPGSGKIFVLLGGGPPVHEWYAESRPGAVLIRVRDRCDQTTLTRF